MALPCSIALRRATIAARKKGSAKKIEPFGSDGIRTEGLYRAGRRLGRLLVHRAARRRRSSDSLHRALDCRPKPADLGRRATFRIVFARAFAMAERHQEIGAIGDLA